MPGGTDTPLRNMFWCEIYPRGSNHIVPPRVLHSLKVSMEALDTFAGDFDTHDTLTESYRQHHQVALSESYEV